MKRKLWVTSAIAAAFLALIGWISPTPLEWPLAEGCLYEAAMDDGVAEFDLPFDAAGDAYLLVVSNLANQLQRATATLKCDDAEMPGPRGLRRVAPIDIQAAPADLWRPENASAKEASAALPERTFWLKVGSATSENPATYRPISATLAATGIHAAVYVDGDDRVCPSAVDAIIRVFDSQVMPRLTPWFGTAADTDGDGRLCILLTSWLGRLDEGRVRLGGMVSPADFDPRGKSPQSNRADVLYLNANLRPGQHLETLLAHEYAHAVISSTRQRISSGQSPVASEESWLNEALAHVAENLQGAGWSNLDHRVAARLASDGDAPLVIPRGYAASHGRWPAVRGSGYLFLRWCVARYGLELIPRLVHSPHTGVANLEAATGESFARLYRQFSCDLFQGDWQRLAGGVPADPTLAMPPLFGAWGDHALAGLRHRTWNLAEQSEAAVEVRGTSSCYLVVRAEEPGRRRITIAVEQSGPWQVTVMRLADLPELTIEPCLDVRNRTDSLGAELVRTVSLRNRGSQPLTLHHVAWRAKEAGAEASSPYRPAHQQLCDNQTIHPGEIVAFELSTAVSRNQLDWLQVHASDVRGKPLGYWWQSD